jgi:hypothetical protein
MLIWLLTGVGAAALFAILVVRNAELDDKRRKMPKRASTPNTWR